MLEDPVVMPISEIQLHILPTILSARHGQQVAHRAQHANGDRTRLSKVVGVASCLYVILSLLGAL